MRRPSGTARKESKPGTKVLVMVLFIGGIAIAMKHSIKWTKDQLIRMDGAAHKNSIKEQNRLNWCADVLESDSISECDYAYCKEFWKD